MAGKRSSLIYVFRTSLSSGENSVRAIMDSLQKHMVKLVVMVIQHSLFLCQDVVPNYTHSAILLMADG